MSAWRATVVAAAALACAAPALAQDTQPPPEPPPLPAGITNRDIAVTSDYRGAQVTVFGFNPAANRGGDVVVVLRGPDRPATVMRKRRVLGLWINGDPVRFRAAPSFFAVYSTRPLAEFMDPSLIWRHQLNAAALAQLAGATPPDTDPGDYRRALVRLQTEAGLYRVNPSGVRLVDDVLFQADIAIPANAPIGAYRAQALVFRNGLLISRKESEVLVDRSGLERDIYDFATRQSFLYGLLTLALALGSGWIAAQLFRRS